MDEITMLTKLMELASQYDTPAVIMLVAGLLLYILRHLTKIRKAVRPLLLKQEKHEPLPCAVRKAYVVQLLLHDLRENLHCDRLSLIQFGNGEFLHGNIPAQKASITFESFGRGVQSIRNRFYGVPLSLFPKWAYGLFQKGFYASPDTKEDELAALLEDFGDKSFYMAALDDQDGNIFGALSVHYCREQHEITPIETALIVKEANKIAGVLLCSLYSSEHFGTNDSELYGDDKLLKDYKKPAGRPCGDNCSCVKKSGVSLVDLFRELADDERDDKPKKDGDDAED